MKTTASLIVLLITLSNVSFAATERVEVTFENSDNYTDIEYNNGFKKNFDQRLFKSWKQYLNEEALKVLPANYTLKISFTDIDLMGTYLIGSYDYPRVITEIDFPVLKFNYQLLKGNRLVNKADVYLKNISFLRNEIEHRRTFRHAFKRTNEAYYYEKRLLKHWIENEIKVLVSL